ncbi:hypothetical protein [Sphingomonas sp. Root710]|uniref:hypothetical protein n=1 Tax=Sphingomonas sp. Root710 TaxID=1736594 RepID=UPI0012E3C68C|nr:hypothetical protein [Sphingomonas sp. Root710]
MAVGARSRHADRHAAGGDLGLKIEDHAGFILDAIKQEPDPTLAELQAMLAERGVSVSIATLWWTCNAFVPVTYLIKPPWLRTRAG